jgi:Protein of unknown function (DUF3768)
VIAFDDFNAYNDPHHDHDFGSFELESEKLFLKIDYYNLASRFGSEDPIDRNKTLRILTVMLAEEYSTPRFPAHLTARGVL